MAKIELPRKPHGMMILRRTYRDLTSQADPREKIELDIIHFATNIDLSRFLIVKNTIMHPFSILTRFDINFLRNA